MDAKTAYKFKRYTTSLLRTIRGHVPSIRDFRSGTGFVCQCSCGKRIARPTGCNVAGYSYAIHYARQAFERHIVEEKARRHQASKT